MHAVIKIKPRIIAFWFDASDRLLRNRGGENEHLSYLSLNNSVQSQTTLFTSNDTKHRNTNKSSCRHANVHGAWQVGQWRKWFVENEKLNGLINNIGCEHWQGDLSSFVQVSIPSDAERRGIEVQDSFWVRKWQQNWLAVSHLYGYQAGPAVMLKSQI